MDTDTFTLQKKNNDKCLKYKLLTYIRPTFPSG